jgi:chromosome segregation ATPase
MRHYPIRSQRHGERKLFEERITRFDPMERQRGWHVQYDALATGDSLVAKTDEVLPYDLTDARIQSALRNRDLESVRAAQGRIEAELAIARTEVTRAQAEIRDLQNEALVLQSVLESVERLKGAYTSVSMDLTSTRSELSLLRTEYLKAVEERDRLVQDTALLTRDTAHLEAELHALHRSGSWRITLPLRVLWRWLQS